VKDQFLQEVGEHVRTRREALGLTQKQLSARSGLSLRFLAQLERGDGNISLRRFADVAEALGTTPAELLRETASRRGPVVALIGLRGAGKSTVGPRLAEVLGVPFVELDLLIEQAAGLSLAEIFELHGEIYYRRLERETLRRFFAADHPDGAVLATGGSIVNDRESYRLLRDNAVTVWLRARPEDHWNRVIQQGDQRPMAQSPQAFAELRALLAAREPLYAAAHHTIDTSRADVDGVVRAVVDALGAPATGGGSGRAGR
jgi:XRE family aerobic/anaerobic benzoate catabolism transcriptional regulator